MDAKINNPTLQAVAPVVTQTVQAVQSQLDGLAAASQALVGALDELSKIHPFVTSEYKRSCQDIEYELISARGSRRDCIQSRLEVRSHTAAER